MPDQQQRKLSWANSGLVALLVLSIGLLLPLLVHRGSLSLWAKQNFNDTLIDTPWSLSGVAPLPNLRSRILPWGSRVACWPSSGGVWIKHATPAELRFLELSPSNDVSRPWPPIKAHAWVGVYLDDEAVESVHPSAIEEDLFCERMRLLGAHFWKVTPDSNSLTKPIELTIPPTIRGHLGFAWQPSSGNAAIVNLSKAQHKDGTKLEAYYKAGKLSERYPIIESMGGIHCDKQMEACRTMWCSQYPDFCYESHWLYEWSDAYNRWMDYLHHRYPLEGQELASYGTDEWVRDPRTNNFYWKHGGIVN